VYEVTQLRRNTLIITEKQSLDQTKEGVQGWNDP
jgi:hypothetical protein